MSTWTEASNAVVPEVAVSQRLQRVRSLLPTRAMGGETAKDPLEDKIDPAKVVLPALGPTATPSPAAGNALAALSQDATPAFVMLQLQEARDVIAQHREGMRAAIDALDVNTIALLAGLLEADLAMVEEVAKPIHDPGSPCATDPALRQLLSHVNGELHTQLPEYVSLLMFRGTLVTGRYQLEGYPVSVVNYLHEEVPQLLRAVDGARRLVELLREDVDDSSLALRAAEWMRKDSGRPVNVDFKIAVLKTFGLWPRLNSSIYGLWLIDSVTTKAERVRAEFGSFIDVGEFNSSDARKKLSYYWDDWRISDSEAIDVVKMFDSTRSQTGRDVILEKLHEMGKLGRLASNLPWKTVQQLHDATTSPHVKAALLPHFREFIEKEPSESLSSMYDRWAMSQARKSNESDSIAGQLGHGALAYGAVFLHTAHNALTFGFLDSYSEAYDLHQQGLISEDAMVYQQWVALARTGVVMAATVLSGGTASGGLSGGARALGMSRGGATVVGNVGGGAASGIAGTLTSDLINIAFLDQEGLSSATTYLAAAGIGAGLGAVGAVGELRYPKAAQETGALYAQRHPWLRNLVQASERAGLKAGTALRNAPSSGSVPFPKPWSSMSPSERQAFQHAYSRHAAQFKLGPWKGSAAESLRVEFNAKATAVRDNAMYSIERPVPYGKKGSGVPSKSVDVRMYVASIDGELFYYWETVGAGEFVSAGLLDSAFTPGAGELVPVMTPPVSIGDDDEQEP